MRALSADTYAAASEPHGEASASAWLRSLAGATLAAAFLVAKVPTLDTPAYWDEMAWFSHAHWLAGGSLLRAIPGLRGAGAFFGHPPGLHATFAVVAEVFGSSLAVAHALIAVLAAVGVWFTYRLGATLFDTRTGLLGAAALFTSPLYFAQAGMFLADVPVAALGVTSIHLALRGWYWPYLACTAYMVLLKETAMALVAALLVYFGLVRGALWTRAGRRELVWWALPLVPIVAFALVQRLATGHYFFIYDPETIDITLFQVTPAVMAHQLLRVTQWIFLYQHRWIFTAAIVLSVAINRSAWRRPELGVFVLVCLLSGYSFAALFFLRRYLLPVLPFFYLAGAWAVTRLVAPRWRTAAAVAALAASASSLLFSPFDSNGEVSLRYLDVVRGHRAMAAAIETEHPGARVLTAWPHTTELERPSLGYVASPVSLVAPPRPGDAPLAPADADLILTSPVPATAGMDELRALARAHGWRLVRQTGTEPAVSELYARP